MRQLHRDYILDVSTGVDVWSCGNCLLEELMYINHIICIILPHTPLYFRAPCTLISHTYLAYAVHAGDGSSDGFSVVTVSQVDLSVASLDASVRLVIDLVLQSWEMQSSHLLGRWSLGLWPLTLPSVAFFWISCVLHSVDVAKVFQSFLQNSVKHILVQV